MEHTLLLDFRDGFFHAKCSCGGWKLSVSTFGPERPTEAYHRIEQEHWQHAHPAPEADSPKGPDS
jgi:hypothetical protein